MIVPNSWSTIAHLHMWPSKWPLPHSIDTGVRKRPDSLFKFLGCGKQESILLTVLLQHKLWTGNLLPPWSITSYKCSLYSSVKDQHQREAQRVDQPVLVLEGNQPRMQEVWQQKRERLLLKAKMNIKGEVAGWGFSQLQCPWKDTGGLKKFKM